ncbi:MAG: hypothetical protein ACWA40_10450 [Planktomarina sp.]
MSNPENNLPRRVLDTAIDAARIAKPVVDHADGRKHIFVPDG